MRNRVIFFFSSRRRHTRLQGDWSSDVCSSDLETADQRCLVAGHSGNRLALAHDAEAAHPVSVEASAREGPAPVDPPTALGLLRRPGGLGYAGNQHVRAGAVGLIVGL